MFVDGTRADLVILLLFVVVNNILHLVLHCYVHATLIGSVQLVQLDEVSATCCLRGGLMFVVRQHKLSRGGMA
jgi:hypothetical protein